MRICVTLKGTFHRKVILADHGINNFTPFIHREQVIQTTRSFLALLTAVVTILGP